MSTEISVAQALVQLKTLDKRIVRTLKDSTFGGIQVGKKVTAGFANAQEIEDTAKSSLQSSKALIKRRNDIKSAIVVSNALTKVVIGSQDMSVAEAIERKASIAYEQTLLAKLKDTYTRLTREVDNINDDVQRRLDSHLETLFGKEGKVTAKENDEIVQSFKRENEAKLIDSINLRKQIEDLENSIEEFLENVDMALNESNVLTKIVIED